MKAHPTAFFAGLIAVPVLANAASSFRSLLSNPTEITNDKGIVVLVEETANSVSKGKVNIDRNGVTLKGYDPVAYFTLYRARQR
jgi:hypothetical protein